MVTCKIPSSAIQMAVDEKIIAKVRTMMTLMESLGLVIVLCIISSPSLKT
jgi:hypothetical protein